MTSTTDGVAGHDDIAPNLTAAIEAIDEFRRGRAVIIVDNDDRENEGDLCIPAQFVTPETITFMTAHARGLICVALTGERLDQLDVPLMTGRNTSPLSKHFTVTVEARDGVTTGASAHDKSQTIKVLVDPTSRPEHLTRPGHMFPLRARDGGVLVRAGHTESAVDLCRLADCYPAAVICEMILENGKMARMPDLIEFARHHDIKIVTVSNLIAYRLHADKLIERIAEAELPSRYGDFKAIAYRSLINTSEHVAFVMGDISGPAPVLVRLHNQCVIGDTLRSLSCDCGHQLQATMRLVGDERRGVIVYLYRQDQGISIHEKSDDLQDKEHLADDSVLAPEAMDRPGYEVGMQILADLGVEKMRLITDKPVKCSGLDGYGLEIVELVSL